ncbi:TPA: hypothetical protein DCP76_02735 [Patescibacteria group bacterium]|nr:hypothetical protein [Patescibacteria group bacterium]HAM96690.1 hypothetical protein [Patescibacteria group bacterium]
MILILAGIDGVTLVSR